MNLIKLLIVQVRMKEVRKSSRTITEDSYNNHFDDRIYTDVGHRGVTNLRNFISGVHFEPNLYARVKLKCGFTGTENTHNTSMT